MPNLAGSAPACSQVRPTLNHSGWMIRDGDDRHMSGVRPSR